MTRTATAKRPACCPACVWINEDHETCDDERAPKPICPAKGWPSGTVYCSLRNQHGDCKGFKDADSVEVLKSPTLMRRVRDRIASKFRSKS